MVKALRHMQDLRDRHVETTEDFLEMRLAGFVAPDLLGGDDLVELDSEGLLCSGKQGIVVFETITRRKFWPVVAKPGWYQEKAASEAGTHLTDVSLSSAG